MRELSLESEVKQLGALQGAPLSAGVASMGTATPKHASPRPMTPLSMPENSICDWYLREASCQAVQPSPQHSYSGDDFSNSKARLPPLGRSMSQANHSEDLKASSSVPASSKTGPKVADTGDLDSWSAGNGSPNQGHRPAFASRRSGGSGMKLPPGRTLLSSLCAHVAESGYYLFILSGRTTESQNGMLQVLSAYY